MLNRVKGGVRIRVVKNWCLRWRLGELRLALRRDGVGVRIRKVKNWCWRSGGLGLVLRRVGVGVKRVGDGV